MGDNNVPTHTRAVWVPSTIEQRFITSSEQMKVLLDNIRGDDEDDESDDSDCMSQDTVHEMPEHCEESEQTKRESDPIKSDWNFVDEYVNFIDLSALNPMIDPADCQKDQLIESEIESELSQFSISTPPTLSMVVCFSCAIQCNTKMIENKKKWRQWNGEEGKSAIYAANIEGE